MSGTILIVDDDSVSRHLLCRALDEHHFQAHPVASGSEALLWLEENVPKAVLLDLVMPAPDGYSVLSSMREKPHLAEVPVVVLTALDNDEEVARAFSLGADDFVRKPFRATELVARLRGQLRMHEYTLRLSRKQEDARVVLELTQALCSTLDFRNILFTVVSRIAEVASADRCSIVLTQGEDRAYVVASSDNKNLHDLAIDLRKYPELSQLIRTSEVIVLDDAPSHPLLGSVKANLPQDGFRSLTLVPIVFEGRPVGALCLRSRNAGRLADHELSLARTVANATAIALRNARIFQNLRDQTQRVTSARFEAEKKLKALEPYADFFHSAADGIVVVSDDGHVLFSNARAQAISGLSEAELASGPLEKVVDPKEEDKIRMLRNSFRRGIFPTMVDIAIWRTTETACERRILNVSFGRLHHEGSGAMLVSFRDVTDDRATAAELVKTKDFLERVIESSADAIISADTKGRVLLFNPAAERIYGYPASAVVGKMNVRDLYPSGYAKKIGDSIRSAEFGGPGRLHGYRTEVLSSDGTCIPVLLSAALIFDHGSPVGSVGVFTDLREMIRIQDCLTQAQEELRARETQALIAELAGAAAHELNQPLTSVLGYAELIRRNLSQNTDLARANIDHASSIILNEAERMAEIVRKVGKITRFETKSYVGNARILDLERSSEDNAWPRFE